MRARLLTLALAGLAACESRPSRDGGAADATLALTCATPATIADPSVTSGTLSGSSALDGCGGTGVGAEHVYRVVTARAGSMQVRLSTGLGTIQVLARSTCPDSGSELGCAFLDASVGGFQVPVDAGQELFVIVQSLEPEDALDYVLEVFTVDYAEPCAAALAIPTGTVRGDTGKGSDAFATCLGGLGREKVYALVPPGDPGTLVDLHVALSAATPHQVSVLSECGGGQGLCGNPEFENGVVRLSTPAEAGVPLWLVVEAMAPGDEGPFELTTAFETHVCGDGWRSASEACDPPGGACLPTCVLAAESLCENLVDDDGDQLIDCADPDCQGRAECQPGSAPIGAPCQRNSDCASTEPVPICFSELGTGFPGGSCSRWCGSDLDCGSGATCVRNLGSWTNPGQCAVACAEAPCPPGYSCVLERACTADCASDPSTCESGTCGYDYPLPFLCVLGEAGRCHNGTDDDHDEAHDCSDVDCIGDPGCPAPTELEPNDWRTAANPIAGEAIGALGDGDEDFYRVTVPAGAALRVELEALSELDCLNRAISPNLEVFNSSSVQVGIFVDGSTAGRLTRCPRGQLIGLPAGTYAIRVSAWEPTRPAMPFVYRLTVTTPML